MKYVIYQKDGVDVPIIGMDFHNHYDLLPDKTLKIISAGFCSLTSINYKLKIHCYGSSVGLGISSKDDDCLVLNKLFEQTSEPTHLKARICYDEDCRLIFIPIHGDSEEYKSFAFLSYKNDAIIKLKLTDRVDNGSGIITDPIGKPNFNYLAKTINTQINR